jgi:hypothetical protein
MKAQKKRTKIQFAVCVNNSGYPSSLELHKIYRVIPDEDVEIDGDIRIIDESGEDYIYSGDRFVLIKVPEEVRHSLLRASQ